MKRIIISVIVLCITCAYAKDYNKTEEIINNILKEESESSTARKETGTTEKSATIENQSTDKEKKTDDTQQDNKPEEKSDENTKMTAMTGSDEVLLKTGIQLFESSMYDHSLAKFNDLKKTYPASKFIDSARMWSGKIYIRKYDYDNAIKEFDGITEKSGEYPAALYYKGDSYRLKGDVVAAIENYQKVYSTYPDNELADNSILITGKLFLSSGKGYQALESALKIIRNYKDSESIDDAYYLIAKIYEKDPMLKDMEMARKFYRVFLKKADAGQKHFTDSPLKSVVIKDLEHLDKTYFRMDR